MFSAVEVSSEDMHLKNVLSLSHCYHWLFSRSTQVTDFALAGYQTLEASPPLEIG